jgi:hypothetical protein
LGRFQIRFNGKSYVSLVNNVIGIIEDGSELIITIVFSTKEPNGLLLWQGKTEKKENFIAVGSKPKLYIHTLFFCFFKITF